MCCCDIGSKWGKSNTEGIKRKENIIVLLFVSVLKITLGNNSTGIGWLWNIDKWTDRKQCHKKKMGGRDGKTALYVQQ